MEDVVLSLGSNLGDRFGTMAAMERELAGLLQPPLRRSPLMESEPVGVEDAQPWYLNRLLAGGFTGTPRQLLERCQAVEQALGRQRPRRYAARTADIDILLFGDCTVGEPGLTLPHPRIRERRFCLEGLAALLPHGRLPGTTQSFVQCLQAMGEEVRRQQVRVVPQAGERSAAA